MDGLAAGRHRQAINSASASARPSGSLRRVLRARCARGAILDTLGGVPTLHRLFRAAIPTQVPRLISIAEKKRLTVFQTIQCGKGRKQHMHGPFGFFAPWAAPEAAGHPLCKQLYKGRGVTPLAQDSSH